jgi:hypothetical protein
VELDWVKKKAGLAPGGEARVHRARASADQCRTAGRAIGSTTVNLLLPRQRREPGESPVDATPG